MIKSREETSTQSSFLHKLWNKIKNFFHELKPLVAMQLKDKIDFSFTKSKKKTLFKAIYFIALFAVITFAIYFLLNLVVNLSLFSFLKMLNFRFYLVVLTVCLILSIITCLVGTTRALYFAKDNSVLLTLPVSTNKLFLSKLIVSYIYELIKNSFYLLPLLIAFGMVSKFPFLFYLYAIVMLIFITFFIVVLCGFLSIFAMGIAILFKKHKIAEIVLVAIVIGGGVGLLFWLITLIPQNIDLVRDWGRIYYVLQDFLAWFAKTFVPFDFVTQLLTGAFYNSMNFTPITNNNILTFLIILASIILLLVFVNFLSKPLFLKMASSPFEYRKVNKIKNRKNPRKTAFVSVVDEETRRSVRTPDIIYSVLAVAIITPLAIYLQNRIVGAMDTRILGNYMAIAFNIGILLLLVLNSNVAMSSAFSKEGNSAYLNKVNPVSYGILLSGKLVLNAFLAILSIIASCIIINFGSGIGAWRTILLCVSIIEVYLGHLFWSAEYDIMNPQNNQYQTTGVHVKNPNETKSTILSFFVAILFSLISYLLIKEDIRYVFYKLLFISTVFFCVRSYLFFIKIKLYYREK